jgi:hypothetical protein
VRRRIRSGLLRLPGDLGYRLARALHVRGPARAAPSENGSPTAPLTVELDDAGRRRRLRVRAADDLWSEDFREELAGDRRFEASLVWHELAILLVIAAVLVARTIAA